jgi:hypothetical protein
MGWFLHWIVRPLFIGLIVRLLYGGGTYLLGTDPGVLLLGKFINAPSTMVIELARWFVILVVSLLVVVWLELQHRRSATDIPGLKVLPSRSQHHINGHLYDAVNLTFTNRTGSTLRLSDPKLREHPKHFPIPPAAVRDISGGGRELKFVDRNNAFVDHERVLKPNDSAITTTAVTQAMDNAFYAYDPGWLRRYFRWPKYFLLRYTVTVGNKKYQAETVY